jgi:hypothetical protein
VFYAQGYTVVEQPTGGSTAAIFWHRATGPQNVATFIQGFPPNTAGSITVSGGTSSSYNTTSDERLKENRQDLTDCLDTVMQLKPISYRWKVGEKTDDIGFGAQTTHRVVPTAVTEGDIVATHPDDPQWKAWQMDPAKLMPFAIGAIKEQQTIIEDLANRVAALESRLAEGASA